MTPLLFLQDVLNHHGKTDWPLSLILPATNYQDYLSRAKTDTSCIRYVTILAPYTLPPPPPPSAAAADPANVEQLIYAATQEGVPTAFLQWHQGATGRGAQIALLYLVTSYVPRRGLSKSPWDDLYFASKGDIICGFIPCANWKTASFHQIGATVHVPTILEIDTGLYQDPDADLLGNFTVDDADVEPLCV